ncbi:MAG: flagellar hook-associated protein FlgK [Armatimonadetes bacterium]|nr:flagellar hook-associated protein FlgK [Armatimonadota bacterium]
MSLRLLNIARTALFTHRTALEVIGQNTANVETPGYVRQRPVLEVIPTGTGTGSAGGVRVADIQRLTDELLSAQVRRQSGWLGQEQAMRATLEQVEHLFSDLTEGGLAARIEEMFDAWADLGLQPTSPAAREQVVQRADLVARTLTGRRQGLAELRAGIDRRLDTDVAHANALAHEIAAANQHIAATTDPAARNDLMSHRDLLVDQLADLCGAEVIREGNDTVDVVIGGLRMVQMDTVTELRLIPDPAQPGMHRIALGDVELGEELRGELGGRLLARDELLPAYMQRLDTLAQSLADEINAVHSAGFDAAGNPAGDFFEYDPARPGYSLQVRQAIQDDPALIGASESATLPADGTNALVIEDLRNSRPLDGGASTFAEYSADIVAQVGIDSSAARTRVDGRQALVDNLRASQSSRTQVSLDEEALELVRYQQAYNASARMLSVAVDMMDRVIELK